MRSSSPSSGGEASRLCSPRFSRGSSPCQPTRSPRVCFPERVGTFDSFIGYRLSEPLGYWNALSVFVAIGIVVAVGLAAHARSITLRALSAASLVLLFPVLYFTFGRGGWIAVASGLAAAIVVDPRRLRLVTTLLVILPWPALAIWRAYESPSLTTQYSALEDVSEEGARLAVTIGVLAVVSAAAMTAYALLADRVTVGRGVRRVYAAVLVLALVGCIAGVIAAYGGPADSARRALDSIRQSSPNVTGDQTKRLFSLSAHHRTEIWESALEDAQANPVLGSGAGTFERWWLEHRDIAHKVRDAHSLYLETLAELDPVAWRCSRRSSLCRSPPPSARAAIHSSPPRSPASSRSWCTPASTGTGSSRRSWSPD